MTDLYDLAFAAKLNGGSQPTLTEKSITANGVYNAADDNADGYSKVTANVPNTYAAGDEGKVVSNGALVAQTALSVTENGTYDTTKKNSVSVNVPPPDYSIDGFTNVGQYAYSTGVSGDWSKPYEIQVCIIKLADALLSPGLVVGCKSGHVGVPKLAVTDNRIAAVATTTASGSDVDIFEKLYDSPPMVKNEPFWIRLVFDGGDVGVGIFKVLISYNGTEFEEIGRITITAPSRDTTGVNYLAFGSSNNDSRYTVFPNMNIVWNECYIKIDGQTVWGRSDG